MMAEDPVARVRRFNRTVTARIGALRSRYLGRGRSLGASRLLFEIGTDGAEVRALRARLALDSGYLSRLLRALEREGLVRTVRARRDARARVVSLTAAGRRELATLNRLSDQAAAALLAPLTDRQRDELVAAMDIVERLLRAGAVALEEVDVRGPEARACLDRYFAELQRRFERGFEQGRSLVSVEMLRPPRGAFVLARLGGEPVGCAGLRITGEATAEIKRMWVAEQARGLGIARRMLAHLERLARRLGVRVLRLETNRALLEAQALYRSSGFREVPAFNAEPYADHWFEKAIG